jgi:hypothetical protein
MKWKSLPGWVGTCVLASGWSTGCNQPQVQPSSQPSGRPPMVYSSSPSARIPGYTLPGTPNREVWGTPPVVQTTTPPELVQAKAESPESKPLEAPPTLNTEIAAPPAITPTAAATSGDPPANPALAQSAPSFPRSSLPDHMVTLDFGHAEDYSWLAGKLQYSRFNKSWRLRFASVDEEDRYGGSVTIVDLPLAGLKDGQMVRVEGHLVNPEAKTSAPPYEVNSIQALEKRD